MKLVRESTYLLSQLYLNAQAARGSICDADDYT